MTPDENENGEETATENTDFVGDFKTKYESEAAELGRFNLVLVGRTGAGKSTLINAFFGPGTARTGNGRPVTQETTYYPHPSELLGIYDCRGFETGEAGNQILKELKRLIIELRAKDLSEQVHVVWYVVSSHDKRFEDAQAEFVKALADMDLPVVVVMTQVQHNKNGQPVSSAEQFADAISRPTAGYIVGGRPILTQALADEELGQTVHGLEELLDATFQVAPSGVIAALEAVQKIDVQRKRKNCRAIIASGAATAGAIGFTPIPMADAALIIPAQVGMMTGISRQFGLPFDAATIASLAKASLLAGGAASFVGKGLANLLKFIPGVGTGIGGAINATIASSLTTAIGFAWMAACEALMKMDPKDAQKLLNDTSQITEIFLTAFKERTRGL